jgi:predicted adenylyl cyclase CyaB
MARMPPILAPVSGRDLEQEMKIPVANLAAVRQRVAAAGGQMGPSRQHETNLILDDARDGLRAAGKLLRLRAYGTESVLTFKGPARFAGGVKSRLELETTVGRPEQLLALLGELGLAPRRRYDKLREVWDLAGVAVALDVTPMGSFVELEGTAAELPDLAGRLGLDPDQAVAASYQELWVQHRAVHPEAPVDMVFAANELGRLLDEASGTS